MSTKVVCWDDRESIKYLLSNLPSSQTLTVFTRYIPTLTIWGFHHAHDSPSPISLSTAITAILFSQWWRPFQFEGWLCYDKNYRMIFYPIINLLPSCSSFSAPCDFYLQDTPYILHQRGGKRPIAGYAYLTAFPARAYWLSPLAMTRSLMMRRIIAGG